MSGSHNASPTPDQSLKRTREESFGAALDLRPFLIRSDSSDPFARPLRLNPLGLLSRAQLPLAYLDTTHSGPRIFSGGVRILDKCHDFGEYAAVLLAREETEGQVYAVEWVRRDRYALCRLRASVDAYDLLGRPKTDVPFGERPAKRRQPDNSDNADHWWLCAAVDERAIGSHQIHRAPKLFLGVKHAHASQTPGPAPSSVPVAPFSKETGGAKSPIKHPGETQQSPRDVLQELSRQYLDMLYLSRTSLAYFSKGPLSRARAAFTGAELEATPSDLVNFLNEAIISSNIMDRKFKDGIQTVVKEIPADTPEKVANKRKRRKWKPKRDKTGFLVDEKEFVEKWWREGDDIASTVASTEMTESALQRRVPKLRNRETFLQVILILEVLALEDVHVDPGPPTDATTQKLHEAASTTVATPEGGKNSKRKKKTDLPNLLETMLDKLCIWYSLESGSPLKQDGETPNDDGGATADELRNFCIEVVIPFYGPRVPRHAAVVNRKLGGPTAPTPVKRRLFASSKPGEPAVRRPPVVQGRAPGSSDVSGPNNQGSIQIAPLLRSASDPEALTTIKRESTEPLLASIPATRTSTAAPGKRRSLMHSMSFSRREVDLSAMSQANEAKMRKKADIQAKMQEAISNIKKPNRELAVRDMAESTDESFARATARARSSNAQRPKLVVQQSIHVAATPRHARSSKATPYRGAAPADASSALNHVTSSTARRADDPPSSGFAVPQTNQRARHQSAAPHPVAETPSRGFARFMPPGLGREPGTLDSSPIAYRRSAAAIEQTPIRPVRSLALPSLSERNGEEEAAATVDATPLRRSIGDALADASPNAMRAAGWMSDVPAGEAKSIYASLGWDDEDEYEELA